MILEPFLVIQLRLIFWSKLVCTTNTMVIGGLIL